MRNKIIFFLMLLVMIFFVPNTNAQADYGENDTYLGQVVDNYFNDDYVNATINVVHNVTLGCMELEVLNTTWSNEDFTTYTEVDIPADRITGIVSNYYQHVIVRGEATYMYKDYGVDYFDEFYIRFSGKSVSTADYGIANMLTVSNIVDDEYSMLTNKDEHITVRFSRSGSNYRIHLIYTNSTNYYLDLYQNYIVGNWYYFDLNVTDDNVHLDIYSDYERNNFIDDLNIKKYSDEEYRYMFGTIDFSSGSASHTVQVMNYSIMQTGYASSGYYYTVNMLDGDRALALLYDAQIVENTGMTLEFSLDNGTTWLSHNNVSTYDDLINGYESLNLIDLNATHIIKRVNMSGDNSNTPRMKQFRYVIIIGEVENGEGGINASSIILAIFLILVSIGLIYGVKK